MPSDDRKTPRAWRDPGLSIPACCSVSSSFYPFLFLFSFLQHSRCYWGDSMARERVSSHRGLLSLLLWLLLLLLATPDTRSTLNAFWSVGHNVNYRQYAIQQISVAHSSCTTESLHRQFPVLPPPETTGTATIPTLLLSSAALDTLYTWDCAGLVLLQLVYFT